MLSRVADNLYWMSRYLERAEHTARLVDVHLNLALDQSNPQKPGARWERLITALHVPPLEGLKLDEYSMTHRLAFDQSNLNSIVVCIANARENARQVREKISSEMWLQLNTLYLDVRRANIDSIWNEQPHLFFMAIKNGAHLFQGITDTTMVHDEGWQFIQLGRYIERALSLATLLDAHLNAFQVSQYTSATDDYFEWLGLLKCFTAFEAYCKVYNADLRPYRLVEFLMYNAEFPHAMRFCIEQISTALQAISESAAVSKNSRVHRLAGRLRSGMSFDTVDEMLARDTHTYLQEISEQCALIHSALYETYITYAVEAALG
ncbi:MAG: alpha-E domain-containing protein [Anaerolineae bacterium]|nr:alpha-E domain-containing protein [Anaerolineae bacterium]